MPTHDKLAPPRWSDQAVIKAACIKPLLDLPHISTDAMREARATAATKLGKTSVSAATIYNWIRAFKADGINGLEHQRHRDHGQSSLHPTLRQYIIDLLQTQDIALAEVHRLSEREARALELDATQFPSYDQVRFIDSQLSTAAKLYGAKGVRAYRKTNELVTRFEAEHPNRIWQCDHHLLDILIINPRTKKPDRVWITAIIDDYSRAIMGFHLSFDPPNSLHIALALFHAMTKKADERWVMHGIPEILYVDNGKDFKSKHIHTICLHFGIELRPHEPYLARSKGKIERWFRTLKDMCLKYLDGYIAGSPQERPAKVTPTLTFEQLYTTIYAFILETYHERVHSETKEKPRVRWHTALKPVRFVANEADLDHLLEDKPCIVQNDGITFRGRRYTDVEGTLASQIGTSVRIFFNRNDVSWVRVWARDTTQERFLCVAVTGVDAHTRGVHNTTTRAHLAAERTASQKRLQAAEQVMEQKHAASSGTAPPHTAPQAVDATTPKKSRILRYLFELEEDDDA